MGRDEHRTVRGNRYLAQTPKNQIKQSDGMDVEFSREMADAEDVEALKRSEAAEVRVKDKEK